MTPEEQAEMVTLIRAVIAQEKKDEQKAKEEKDWIIQEWLIMKIFNPFMIVTPIMLFVALIYFWRTL
jgi:hypothetical protein